MNKNIPALTKEQALILTGYTGLRLCELDDFYADLKLKFGRPVFTHELVSEDFKSKIKELYKDDFMSMMENYPSAPTLDMTGRVSTIGRLKDADVPLLTAGIGKIKMCVIVNKYGNKAILFSELKQPMQFDKSALPILGIQFNKAEDLDVLIENLITIRNNASKNESM